MRILHTSDWHLGKRLEMSSRLPEQEEFINELIEIANTRRVDLILISGDVYDTNNPPAEAETLFYQTILRLADNGKRPVVIIAGNHDSPERLAASGPLAAMIGVFIVGSQKTTLPKGDYTHFAVTDSREGVLELNLRGESAIIIAMPYPSEKRLNEIFSDQNDEHELQKSYSEKVSEIFTRLSELFREDTINLAMGHFYVRGGESSGSERDVQLGGSYAVDPSALPARAQYIALGHLHRPQGVPGVGQAFYSGSPIQYHKNEIGYAKCVLMAELKPGEEAMVEKIYLRNYKPIEIWKASSITDALDLCRKRARENCWVYFEIQTDRPLNPSEIKEMKLLKDDIVEIRPIMEQTEQESEDEGEAEKSLREEFLDFYQETHGAAPKEHLVSFFLSLAGED